MNKVTILLPAYNEEKSIGLVIDEIRSLPVHCEIIVIDNRSTDLTSMVAYARHVRVVQEHKRGKGNAVRTGIRLVDTPYTVMMDSDYTYPAVYISDVLEMLERGYDIVMGSRDKACMAPLNRLANSLISKYASVLYGYSVMDLCTGMWGFRTSILKQFNLTSWGFTLEADLFMNALGHTRVIPQIPIGFRKRLDGSKEKIRVWDGVRIGWFLLRNRYGLFRK